MKNKIKSILPYILIFIFLSLFQLNGTITFLFFITFSAIYSISKWGKSITDFLGKDETNPTFQISSLAGDYPWGIQKTIVTSKQFLKLIGIKDSFSNFENWKKSDEDKLEKERKRIFKDFGGFIKLKYLANSDTWWVRYVDKEGEMISYLTDSGKGALFSERFFYGKDGEAEIIPVQFIELVVHSEFCEPKEGMDYGWYLRGYLRFQEHLGKEKDILAEDEEYKHLFDFPIDLEKNYEQIEKLGFTLNKDQREPFVYVGGPDYAVNDYSNPIEFINKKKKILISIPM